MKFLIFLIGAARSCRRKIWRLPIFAVAAVSAGAALFAGCANLSANTAAESTLEITFAVQTRGETESFRLVCPLPQTLAGRQTVHSLALSPAAREFSENGNHYAEWIIASPPQKFEFTITAEITLYPFDLTAQNFAPASDDSPASANAAENFLIAEPKIESDDPEIIAFAARAVTGIDSEADATEKAKKILTAIIAEIRYAGFLTDDLGAKATLSARHGDCTDFTDLFVAACRAQKIPARHLSGLLTRWEQTPAHSWAEFFDRRHGWIPVDPLHAKLGKTAFAQLPPRYVELSAIRNDKNLQGGMLYRWEIKGQNASANVRQTVSASR